MTYPRTVLKKDDDDDDDDQGAMATPQHIEEPENAAPIAASFPQENGNGLPLGPSIVPPPPPSHHTVPASPPTPAPSPRPLSRYQSSSAILNGSGPACDVAFSTDEDGDESMLGSHSGIAPPRPASPTLPWSADAQTLTRAATILLPTLPSSNRVTLLSDLLLLLSSHELAQINSFVSLRLRVDFLSRLPIELSLHVLSHIEDPLTLSRAGQVNRFWRSLVNDEHTWEAMCSKYRYRYRSPSTVYPRLNAAQKAQQEAAAGPRSDADLLASLYRRYRERGLDPSNARDELRTLHDLFLAKQSSDAQREGSSAAGSSSSVMTSLARPAEMSSADLRFYEQLEQIVQEESQERYGDGGSEQVASGSGEATRAQGSNAVTPRPRQQSPEVSSSAGWLSSGLPSVRLARTPPGRPSRLPPVSLPHPLFERHDAGHQPAVPTVLSNWTGGLGLPWALSDIISLPSSLTGGAPGVTPVPQASIPPTQAQAPPIGLPLTTINTRPSRPSAPIANRRNSATGSSLGLGRPPRLDAPTGRAVTFAGVVAADGEQTSTASASASGSSSAFSYRAHFKRNFLTESNWQRGGRLLTQHVSTETGCVCTCFAMDDRWLVIGMANGKIHVFDARTGFFEKTLQGRHDSGVWCLALISKTKGSKKQTKTAAEKTDESSSTNKGKGKAGDAVIYTPQETEDGSKEYLTPNRDLRLLKHDPRLPVQPKQETTNSKGKAIATTDALSDSQTLHWFHQARRALSRSRGDNDSPASSRTALPGDLATNTSSSNHDLIDGYPRDLVEAGPEFVRDSILSSARRNTDMSAEERSRLMKTVQEMEENLRRVRKEHGITGHRRIPRPGEGNAHIEADGDAEMTEATSQSQSQDDVMNGDAEVLKDEEESGEYEGYCIGLGGTAAGLGTLCSATKGYGNDSAIIVSGGCDRDLKVWDLETGTIKHNMTGHASTVRCLRVLEGTSIAISGGRDSTVRVWDVSTGKLLRVLAGHQNSVRCLEVAGARVATGSYDTTCRVWDVYTGECLHVLRGHYNQIYCIGFDGNKIATGSLDSTVRVWSAETGEPLALLQGHTALVGQLQLSNNTLISGGSDGRIIAYSLIDFRLLYAVCAHDNSVSCLQFDEHFILTGGNDGSVRLWNVSDGSFIRELIEPKTSVWKVGFRDDKVVVLCKREDENMSMEFMDFRPLE